MSMLARVALLALVIVFAMPSVAAEKDETKEIDAYVSFSPGFWFPTGDLDDQHPFGWYSDLIYGRNVHPNASIEFGTAYFHEGNPQSDVRGNTLFLGARGYVPLTKKRHVNLFGGTGIGIGTTKYFGTLNGVFLADRQNFTYAYILYGLDWNVAPRWFVGVEQKFLFTQSVEYDGLVSVNLNGYTAGIRAGYRF